MTKRFHIHKFFPFGGLFAITEEMASGRCDSGNDLENDHFLLHLEANCWDVSSFFSLLESRFGYC